MPINKIALIKRAKAAIAAVAAAAINESVRGLKRVNRSKDEA
jgi:hypothetical protein